MECVRKVLQKLREHDLFLKVSKCTFCKEQVEFLGMTVLGKGISMSEDKLKAITEWKPPTRVKGVRSFLGLANFYRRFIADFAAVTKLLTSLMRKDVPFIWGVPQQVAFDTLKAKFTTAPVLAFPDHTLPMRLET